MKKLLNFKLAGVITLLVAPVIVTAQTIGAVIEKVHDLIGLIVPVVIAIAVVFFLWGVLKYVIAKDPESQKEARGVMINGIIVLLVMISIWGLVAIVRETFKIDGDAGPGDVQNLIPSR